MKIGFVRIGFAPTIGICKFQIINTYKITNEIGKELFSFCKFVRKEKKQIN